MTRYIAILSASLVAAGALMSVDAHTVDPKPQMVSTTQDGKPILLARMVVTAPALPAKP